MTNVQIYITEVHNRYIICEILTQFNNIDSNNFFRHDCPARAINIRVWLKIGLPQEFEAFDSFWI